MSSFLKTMLGCVVCAAVAGALTDGRAYALIAIGKRPPPATTSTSAPTTAKSIEIPSPFVPGKQYTVSRSLTRRQLVNGEMVEETKTRTGVVKVIRDEKSSVPAIHIIPHWSEGPDALEYDVSSLAGLFSHPAAVVGSTWFVGVRLPAMEGWLEGSVETNYTLKSVKTTAAGTVATIEVTGWYADAQGRKRRELSGQVKVQLEKAILLTWRLEMGKVFDDLSQTQYTLELSVTPGATSMPATIPHTTSAPKGGT